MKIAVAIFSLVVLFLVGSCNKRTDNDPIPPGDTVTVGTSALIEKLIYRHMVDSQLVEEIHSIKYDANGNMTEIRRDDQDRLATKFFYSGDQLSAVNILSAIGSVGASYINNQSLFVKGDTISCWFTRDISPEDPDDTIRSEYLFTDSVIDKATFTYVTPLETRSYSGLIYEYDDNGNVKELGHTNTDGLYIKHMNVTSVDDKKNPVRGRVAFSFFFAEFSSQLHMGVNNITSVQYANGDVAQFEYIYNENGFPLTVKNKADNFIKFEFKYKP